MFEQPISLVKIPPFVTSTTIAGIHDADDVSNLLITGTAFHLQYIYPGRHLITQKVLDELSQWSGFRYGVIGTVFELLQLESDSTTDIKIEHVDTDTINASVAYALSVPLFGNDRRYQPLVNSGSLEVIRTARFMARLVKEGVISKPHFYGLRGRLVRQGQKVGSEHVWTHALSNV